MKPRYKIVIPARYASERLPGKLLLDLGGQSVLQRAWQQATNSSAETVVIATDDECIVDAATKFGAEVVLTAQSHQSGSDRIAECAEKLQWQADQLIVNLQGDEPLMPAACLDQVAELLHQHPDCGVASLYWPVNDVDELNNRNAVKVVTDTHNRALYFSRSPIPFYQGHLDAGAADSAGACWKRHLGLYAYRLTALRQFAAMTPSPLETAERLEQLRILENGGDIQMAEACEFIPAGIDTAEDLNRIRRLVNP